MMANRDFVAGSRSNKETLADMDRETVVSSLFDSVSRGREIEIHKILERKVESAFQGERMVQQKLYQAEAEVEARNWGKRNSDIASQEFDSQRFQVHQASRWAYQAHRDEISLVWRSCFEKQALPRRSCKRLPRN